MFTYATKKGRKGYETIEKVIESDISKYKKKYPDLVVTDVPAPLLTRKEKSTAIVKYFRVQSVNSWEAVAYIDEPKTVVFIIFASGTEKDFEASLPKFKELVSSYFFMKVKMK